jgi:hypothetical protein
MHPLPAVRPRAAVDFRPRQPGVHVLLGDGRHGRRARPVAEAWVALALASGHVVHWIDGACRLDPGRFSPWLAQLGVGPRALASLRVARGFTAHQFAAMVARLAGEVKDSGSRLIVVDAPMAMFDDDELRAREGRDMVRHLCADLERASSANDAIVIVVHGRHDSRAQAWRTQRLLHMARSRLDVAVSPEGGLRLRRGEGPWRPLQSPGVLAASNDGQPTLSEWATEGLQVPAKGSKQGPCSTVETTDVDVHVRREAR